MSIERPRISSALTATWTKQSAGKFALANLFLDLFLIGGECNTRCLSQSVNRINSPTSESVLMQVSTWYFCEPDIQEHWERRNAPRRRRTKTGWRDYKQATKVKRVSAGKRGLKKISITQQNQTTSCGRHLSGIQHATLVHQDYLDSGAWIGKRRVKEEGQQIHDCFSGVFFLHDVGVQTIQRVAADLWNMKHARNIDSLANSQKFFGELLYDDSRNL